MSTLTEIAVPDIGGAENVEVIEIAVKPGDQIKENDTLITIESEKASIDIPAPKDGVVKELKVKKGDKVSQGSPILMLETTEEIKSNSSENKKENKKEKKAEGETKASASSEVQVHLPDIGTEAAVKVIEVHLTVGENVKLDEPVITLESEKASMDIPSPQAGKVVSVNVKVGDTVKHNDLIYTLLVEGAVPASQSTQASTSEKKSEVKTVEAPKATTSSISNNELIKASEGAHAGPAVRRLAFELGVDLSKVTGTGRKGRILPEDVHAFVKRIMQSQQAGGTGLNIAPMPEVDFSKFGEIEKTSLSRIKKISGAYLHRNWVSIPHITQFEEADITDMEAFRKENKVEFEKEGLKLTPLVFIIKAVVESLQAMPQFNSSLALDGESLILKKYYHIGVAVDTPNGLVVPVIRDADKKGIKELAKELGELSKKARDGKLLPSEMQGGCFSISSLGGIGGTAFTPIINAPEVAILGVSRSEMKPKFIEGEFKPRLMLPLSLSYDHRVIDGADGARFVSHLSAGLSDLRRLLF